MIIGHFDTDMGANGGITTYIRQISEAQRLKGHKVFYFSRHPAENTIIDGNIPIHIKSDDDLFSYASSLNLDILHLHAEVGISPPSHIPVLRTLHGHHPYCPSGSKYLGRWQKPCDRPYSPQGCLWGHVIDGCGSLRPKSILRNFQYTQDEQRSLHSVPILTVSDFLRQQLIASGYQESLVRTIHLFCPKTFGYSQPPQDQVPQFVFLGRITPLKGLECLLNAISKVTAPVHLNIAGDGYQKEEMEKLAHKLKISDKVSFHGWLNPDAIKNLIDSARAVIFPSVWHEPAGFVTFEAMARSRAVIASNVGGIPEIIDHKNNGILVNPNDPDEMASAIHLLATDWTLSEKLGRNGREHVEQYFQLSHHMDKLMCRYEELALANNNVCEAVI